MNSKINLSGKSTILFDLDATLLPFHQKELADEFFCGIKSFAAKKGCDTEKYEKAFYLAFNAMKKNDGSEINNNVFHRVFLSDYPDFPYNLDEFFDEYYLTDFGRAKKVIKYRGSEKEMLAALRKKGFCVVCATNPVFPMSATVKRMAWGGISTADFDYITLHTNCTFSKPSIGYYNEILKAVNKTAEECLMVGNDTKDDLGALDAGIDTILISDYLLDKKNRSLDDIIIVSYNDFYDAVMSADECSYKK